MTDRWRCRRLFCAFFSAFDVYVFFLFSNLINDFKEFNFLKKLFLQKEFYQMPTVKLNTHQRTHYQDDLVICQKDFPDFKIGDIVEIYSNEENFSRLILQITNVDKPKVNFPTITIEQSIAQTFQLRIFSDVIMNILDKNIVALDSVELFFKDQYLARSDMWRLKKHITNTSVYLNKKIEFSNIRCQVFEMWHHGIRWASGYINDETKVVFRSASSMVYLFLQMSSEMWDYDINGDLYFEKAVKGFLSDLFNKWKVSFLFVKIPVL